MNPSPTTDESVAARPVVLPANQPRQFYQGGQAIGMYLNGHGIAGNAACAIEISNSHIICACSYLAAGLAPRSLIKV